MAIRFMSCLGAAAITTALALVSSASAQEAPRSHSSSVPEAVLEIYHGNRSTYFDNRTAWRQASHILGFGGFDSAGFPERETEWDAEAINRAHIYLMAVQNTSDPTIRVPDLYNPYNTSIQLLPVSQFGNRISGSEFVYERFPMQ